MTRVLLISPLPGIDPPCGDVTYTEGLLAHPPAGVEYETYAEALANGNLRELGRRADLEQSRGAARVAALTRILRERAVNLLRRRGVLFREPFRHFRVTPGRYDLVHCHVFSASFGPLDAPLLIGNAATIEQLYRDARGWAEPRVRFAGRLDRWLARAQGVQHTSYSLHQADVAVTFTEFLAAELVERGAVARDRVAVAPCFVDERPGGTGGRPPRRIGFVAGDFDAKGGATVIAAFDLVRRERPDAELVVIGSPPRLTPDEQTLRGISWRGHVPRAQLLADHMPAFDVFAYPTECDGLPLTVLEVMALGVPVITSDYGAMPEIVDHGRAGRVVPQRDAVALASEMLSLLDTEENARARILTREWFGDTFATPAAVARLERAYGQATRRHEGGEA